MAEANGAGTPRPPGERPLWAVVLAGGEGVRLRPLVRQVCGDERPKQFVPLLGQRSLLGQTVNRVARLVPGGRTVVVSVGSQRRYLAAEVARMSPLHVLVQPGGRGTAAAILLAAHWIRARDPHAVVAVCPSDHFVLEEVAFMEHVGQVAETVQRRPRQVVLVGARPAGPEVEYGWIEPGEVIGRAGRSDIRRVAAFREKPSAEDARDLLARGCLWNTFVLVAGLDGLLSLADTAMPEMNERLRRNRLVLGNRARGLRPAPGLRPDAVGQLLPRDPRSPSRRPRCLGAPARDVVGSRHTPPRARSHPGGQARSTLAPS